MALRAYPRGVKRVSYLRIGNPPGEPRGHARKRKARVAALIVAVFVLGMLFAYQLSQLPPN